jgi:hypothetical protein
MERIYHPYWNWEDHKAGFYDNCSGDIKKTYQSKIIEMFSSETLTQDFMLKVINQWKFSCEHNLTNNAVNQIAYIGQGACCIYCGAPCTVTMESWSKVPLEFQERANKIAESVIEIWKSNNKKIQLCLNLD